MILSIRAQNSKKDKSKLLTFTYPNGTRAQLDHIMINKKWKNSALDCQAYNIIYPNGTRAQLHHIMINKKWENSALDCQAYNTFHGVSSDHRIVSANFRLRANVKKSSPFPPYDWSLLTTDEIIKTRFTISVRNRFAALEAEEEAPSANSSSYNNFVIAHEKAAEENIPRKPKLKKMHLK